MKTLKKVRIFTILFVVFVAAAFLRFYVLSGIPAGIHADEASQGFNAYSLIATGKDMYGKSLPILFRANGSYQPPLYTYLSTLPVYVFGNSIFAIRFISALSGLFLVLATFFLVKILLRERGDRRNIYALTAASVVAFSPWGIHFSRLAVEANLAVSILVLGLIFLVLSLKKPKYLVPAAVLFGLSTHAYYSERVVSIIFLLTFIYLFRKKYNEHKKWLIFSFACLFVTLIPHIYIYMTGALTRRLSQVSYLGSMTLFASAWEFIKHYFMYFSPGNLFFDSGSNLGSASPELSVFYDWYFIPFLFGIRFLYQNRDKIFSKVLLLLIVAAPVPAALTGDLFYPLRTLDFFWALSIVISFGLLEMWRLLRFNLVRYLVFSCLVLYSLVSLYVSYFILFKYEEAKNYGFAYVKLTEVANKYKNIPVWIDASDRAWGEGIRLAYLESADPYEIQASLSSQMKSPYYSHEVNSGETFEVGNITVKPIKWGEVCGKMIVVGDRLSVSPGQVKENKLKLLFEAPGLTGEPELFGYEPTLPCK